MSLRYCRRQVHESGGICPLKCNLGVGKPSLSCVSFFGMEFETVKLLLLLKRLEAVPGSELHLLIIDAANSAANLARATPYPGLVFPCLFSERVEISLEQERVRARNYWAPLHRPAFPTGTDILSRYN